MNAAELLLPKRPSLARATTVAHEGLVAGEQAQVEQRRGGREVLLRQRHASAALSTWWPTGERRVPQRVEQRLGEGLGAPGVDHARVDDDHDVGVAAERDRPAPEAAHRGQREPAPARQPGHARAACCEARRRGTPRGSARSPGRAPCPSSPEPRRVASRAAVPVRASTGSLQAPFVRSGASQGRRFSSSLRAGS